MKKTTTLKFHAYFITTFIISLLFFFTGCKKETQIDEPIAPIIDPCDLVDDANVSIDLMWKFEYGENDIYISTLGDKYFYTFAHQVGEMRVYDMHTGEFKLTIYENDIPCFINNVYNARLVGDKIFMACENLYVIDITSGEVSFYEQNEVLYTARTMYLETGLYTIKRVEEQYCLMWYDYQNQEIVDTIYKFPVSKDFHLSQTRLLLYTAPDNEKFMLLAYVGGLSSNNYSLYYDKFSLDTRKLEYHKIFFTDSFYDQPNNRFYVENDVMYVIYGTRQIFYALGGYDFHYFSSHPYEWVDYYLISPNKGLSLRGKKISTITWNSMEENWECNNSGAKQIIVMGDYMIDVIDEGLAMRELNTGIPIKNTNYPGGQGESTQEYSLDGRLIKFDENKVMAFINGKTIYGFQINY